MSDLLVVRKPPPSIVVVTEHPTDPPDGGAAHVTGHASVSGAGSVSASPVDEDGNFLPPAEGSTLIFEDDCTETDPIPIWGAWAGARVDGANSTFTDDLADVRAGRLAHSSSGGPDDLPYRSLTVFPDAPDLNWSAQRDALGYNWWPDDDDGGYPSIPHPGPTVLWKEGDYRMLHLWMRLGEVNDTSYFRQLFEIKQCEPYSGSQTPAAGFSFELQQRNDGDGPIWLASCWWQDTWVLPVTQEAGDWVPFSVEGLWTVDPDEGWIRFKIGDEISDVFEQQTLLNTADNAPDHPSFMEMGPYQDPALPTTTFDYAGIKVYGD